MNSFLVIGPALALILIGAVVLLRALGRRSGGDAPGRLGVADLRVLTHAINDDRCTGCEACVAVCPTNVLGLDQHKSRVLYKEQCIYCRQCEVVCPTEALVMHPAGETPRPVRAPDLDAHSQARTVPGLYLIGEAAGQPLIKNGVNLGRLAIESIRRGGLRPGALQQDPGCAATCDVIIVGSGPAGLSAALTCARHGLSAVVIEKDAFVASTIARYPRGKSVMAEPQGVRCVGPLPVWDTGKDELIAEWNRLLVQARLHIRQPEIAEHVEVVEGGFLVRTDRHRYRGQRLVLAIGGRGAPRRLQVPGADLPHVASLLDDPERYKDADVLVIGGGDSAVEAALALADPALRNRVRLSYRGRQFTRIASRNRQALQRAEREGRVQLLLQTQAVSFQPGVAELRHENGQTLPVPTAHVFALIGGEPPLPWLEKIGVRYIERPFHQSPGPSDQRVEALVGPQPDNGRPVAPPAQDPTQTLIKDQSAEMAAVYASFLTQQALQRASTGEGATLIQVPRDPFLLQLPERLALDEPQPTLRELRATRIRIARGDR